MIQIAKQATRPAPAEKRNGPTRRTHNLIAPARRLHIVLRYVVAFISVVTTFAAAAQTPLSLFNGTSLLGWNQHGMWSATGGAIVTNGTGDRHLLTAVPFGDFTLQFEYNEPAPVGTELRLWTTRENTGGLTVDLDITGAKQGVGGIGGFSRSSIATISPGWHRVQVDASHGQVNVRIDGQPSGSASGLGSRAGYLGFQADGNGQLQVRGIRLMPQNVSSSFNGTDLGGWKSIARAPDAKAGASHAAERVFTFGMGGGSTKPHEAQWTVRGGAMHGQAGPGALENSTPVEDAVIQLTSNVSGAAKGGNFTALTLRNTAGQIGSGYAVGVGPYAGTVDHLAKSPVGRVNAPVEQTIVIGGRTVAVWINGNLVTVANDSRPESGSAAAGARTQAGTTMLLLPDDSEQIDIVRLNIANLQKPYGLPAHAPPPPPTPTVPVAAGPAIPLGTSAAETALLQQQQASAKKDADAQASKQRVSQLMSQALASNDPQQQESLYGQVIQIDPANPNAMQGYKEAQGRLQVQQSAVAQTQSKQQDEQSKEQQTNTSLVTAQSAFLGGHLSEASQALSVAERLSPGNPLVRELRQRIGNAQSLRSRLYFLGGGVGLIAMLSAIALWIRRRRLQRFPVLEVTNGIDSGKVYRIDKDQTRIGAVPQDGGQKNDIVIRDVEHAVSRFHCEVLRRDGQLYLQDLNSSNGTRMNGERLKPGSPELLRKGVRIQLAETVELRFGYDRGSSKASRNA